MDISVVTAIAALLVGFAVGAGIIRSIDNAVIDKLRTQLRSLSPPVTPIA
jgi:hypothetical protein